MNNLDLVSLTEFLIKNLVDDKENVKINLIEEEDVKILQVLVNNDDIGKVIGNKGKIANSIRTIVQASAYHNKLGKVRINIDTL